MNLATIQFKSKALMRHVTYTAILPDPEAEGVGPGPYPVLLQLHGFSDDHTAWVKFSNLVRHARQYPFIIVMPDGATSFYCDVDFTQQYETYMMTDLRAHVAATFQVKEGPWAIGGLSMGGYGALRLGLKYPDEFASVWAHSSAIQEEVEMPPWVKELEDASLFLLAERLAAASPAGGRPAISFDCGVDDWLLPGNRKFHAHLERLGLAHTYNEHPGAHTWEFWDCHVQEALAQHCAILGK